MPRRKSSATRQSRASSKASPKESPSKPATKKHTSLDGKRESEFTLFHFPSHRDKIPEDFIADPETGLRPEEKTKPSGVTKTFLDKGFGDWTAFPPVESWDKGVWFVQLTKEQQLAVSSTVGTNGWESWIVNGEGTPGNFAMRIYVCPKAVAEDVEPDHPLLWPEKLRRPSGGYHSPSYGYSGYSGGSAGWAYQSNAQTSVVTSRPTTTQAPALPREIRFRCADCGHWFKQDQLAPHKTNCCPGKEESRETDWALLCECCLTLDEVGRCKPGFPRPKKEVVKQDEQVEVKQDEASATVEVVQ